MRRAKFAITSRQMHGLLGLPDGVRVVALRVVNDPDSVHVLVEGEEVPTDEVHGRDWAAMAYHGETEAPFLWHPVAQTALTWGTWKPGDGPKDQGSTEPVSRSVATARIAAVLAEHGTGDIASDTRLLRELANTFERLMAEGALEGDEVVA